MADRDLRALERAAAQGDSAAAETLARVGERAGLLTSGELADHPLLPADAVICEECHSPDLVYAGADTYCVDCAESAVAPLGAGDLRELRDRDGYTYPHSLRGVVGYRWLDDLLYRITIGRGGSDHDTIERLTPAVALALRDVDLAEGVDVSEHRWTVAWSRPLVPCAHCASPDCEYHGESCPVCRGLICRRCAGGWCDDAAAAEA